MPQVSVILNVRNGAAFLHDALDSVLAQTFQDWELIAWDDCSTDNSADIIRAYRDPRIHYYLSADDTPLGEARNRAIRQAKGEWLAFLDQDDIWLPCKLEKQRALAASRVGIIYGRTVLFDDKHGNLRDYDHVHEFGPLPEGNIFYQLFSEACFIAMSSALLRRSAVREIGDVPGTIRVVPDYYLYVAIARRYEARAVQQVVCRYRMHPGSMSASDENRLRLHQEPLAIIRQWASFLSPSLVRYRIRTYSTVLALEEMGRRSTFSNGVRRLFTEGSVSWLLSRPFALLWRALRRRIRRPYWLATEFASEPD
jgi:glycosyltransferase involved in cell wall biosynthesis